MTDRLDAKRILVTGGAGMIGSALVRRLLDAGADVHVVDNFWRGRRENLVESGRPVIDFATHLVEADLADPRACEGLFEGFDTVYHLADIVAGIGYVFGNELAVLLANSRIDANVLGATVAARVPNYVYVGTACSYPRSAQSSIRTEPLREDEVYPAEPESAYGWSKLMGEYAAQLAGRDGKLNVGVLRLHNVYGPRCDTSPERAQVIPALIRKALTNTTGELAVWGSGKQRRSFVYVDDVAEALARLRTRAMNTGVIQIGAPASTSIESLAGKIAPLNRTITHIRFDSAAPEGDVDRFPCLRRCRELLGYEPVTPLDLGLRRTADWIGAQLAAPAAPARAAA
jgi:GDP-D-mannose 3',5'-epimerase